MGRPLGRPGRPWGELLAVQEANLGRQMNLIELLEGVLGTSRALPPPFGRVPGGPEGAKVVPWSDFGWVSGAPRTILAAFLFVDDGQGSFWVAPGGLKG